MGLKRLMGAVLAVLAIPAWAGPIGYSQATGYYKKDSRPTLYQPLNLLDGRDATAWCTPGSDPLSELVSIGFKGPVKVEELKITTGNNFDEHTFGEFSRAKKILIKGGSKKPQTITVLDQRGPQAIAFNPPLEGTRFTFEVLDQFPAEDPDQPVCLTDLVFVSEGKPLNGPWLTSKLKYDKGHAPLLGSWFAGFDGTPDRFLAFNYDGTFRLSFEPFDNFRGKEKVLEGTYEASSSRLTFEIPGTKGKLAVKYSRDESKKKGGFTLALEGELPEDFKQQWRSVP